MVKFSGCLLFQGLNRSDHIAHRKCFDVDGPYADQ